MPRTALRDWAAYSLTDFCQFSRLLLRNRSVSRSSPTGPNTLHLFSINMQNLYFKSCHKLQKLFLNKYALLTKFSGYGFKILHTNVVQPAPQCFIRLHLHLKAI